MTLKIEKNQRFNSFKEFQIFFKNYCKQEKQIFAKKESPKLKNSSINPYLIHQRLLYGCKFGKFIKSRGKGLRRTRYVHIFTLSKFKFLNK